MMKNNELLNYALEVSDNTFRPLYLNAMFWLNHLVDNPAAYNAYIDELLEEWDVPDEDTDPDEEIFSLMCQEENDARD